MAMQERLAEDPERHGGEIVFISDRNRETHVQR
jgi:hypothetical protein